MCKAASGPNVRSRLFVQIENRLAAWFRRKEGRGRTDYLMCEMMYFMCKLDLVCKADHGVRAVKAGFDAGDMKQMVSGPTGSGKTELAAGVASLCYDRGTRVSFIADRLVLVDQASDRFWRYGIHHGVIQGDNTLYTDEIIQVYSAQTIESRDYFDAFDLLIVAPGVQVDQASTRMMHGVKVDTLTLRALANAPRAHRPFRRERQHPRRKSNGETTTTDTKVTPSMARHITDKGEVDATMRAPLLCGTYPTIYASCCGDSLTNLLRTTNGLPIRVIAAQSIGEPGARHTMRTFHRGGVAGPDIANGYRA